MRTKMEKRKVHTHTHTLTPNAQRQKGQDEVAFDLPALAFHPESSVCTARCLFLDFTLVLDLTLIVPFSFQNINLFICWGWFPLIFVSVFCRCHCYYSVCVYIHFFCCCCFSFHFVCLHSFIFSQTITIIFYQRHNFMAYTSVTPNGKILLFRKCISIINRFIRINTWQITTILVTECHT